MVTAALNKFAWTGGSLTMHNVLFVQYDSFVYIQKLKSKGQFLMAKNCFIFFDTRNIILNIANKVAT